MRVTGPEGQRAPIADRLTAPPADFASLVLIPITEHDWVVSSARQMSPMLVRVYQVG